MTSPRVSVLLPITAVTGDPTGAIESVLAQRQADFEILALVGSAHAREVVTRLEAISDSRLRPSVVESSAPLELIGAGLDLARGDVIVVLDAAERLRPGALARFVAFLDQHGAIGAVYAGHWSRDTEGTPLSFRCPPAELSLVDPLAVAGLRLASFALRARALRPLTSILSAAAADPGGARLLDPLILVHALLLTGCPIAPVETLAVDHVVAPARAASSLSRELDATRNLLQRLFDAIRDGRENPVTQERVLGAVYLDFAYRALLAGEGPLGRDLLRRAIRFERTPLEMQGAGLRGFLVQLSAGRDDFEADLAQFFTGLPPEMAWLTPTHAEVVARCHLQRGLSALLGGDPERGSASLARAAEKGVRLDRTLLRPYLETLLWFDARGEVDGEAILPRLQRGLRPLCSEADLRWWVGLFYANRALGPQRRERDVPPWESILRAVASDPGHLLNRGIWSLSLRALRARWQR